jgi:hypothetical protein
MQWSVPRCSRTSRTSLESLDPLRSFNSAGFLPVLREQFIFGGNREDAEDALQEAFLLAFIHLQRSFLEFLYMQTIPCSSQPFESIYSSGGTKTT